MIYLIFILIILNIIRGLEKEIHLGLTEKNTFTLVNLIMIIGIVLRYIALVIMVKP